MNLATPRTQIAATAVALMLVAALLAPQARAARPGHVYVQSNAVAANTVLSIRYGRNGTTEPAEIKAYRTGGRGAPQVTGMTAAEFSADQQLIVNPARTLLFTTNQGSDSITVFHILSDGRLKRAKGSPISSGGQAPVSLGLAGSKLVVLNKAQRASSNITSPPNLTVFTVSRDGRLRRVSGSTINLDPGSSPTQGLISTNGKFVFSGEFFSGNIRSFQIGTSGRLSPTGPPQQFPPEVFQNPGPPPGPPGGGGPPGDGGPPPFSEQELKTVLGLAAHPRRPIVYIDAPLSNKIAVYRQSSAGQLTFLRAADNPGGFTPCWNVLTRNGRFMYISNTLTSNIGVWDTRDAANPRRIQLVDVKGPPTGPGQRGQGGGPTSMALDASDSFLYALVPHNDTDSPTGDPVADGNELHAFRVRRDGRLSELDSSPTFLPVSFSTRPQGLATIPR